MDKLLIAFCTFPFLNHETIEKKQLGAELGQAQLQLELGFTLIKVCCSILMITNYHYISLSTINLRTWLLRLTGHSGQNGTACYIVTDFLENFKISKYLKLHA